MKPDCPNCQNGKCEHIKTVNATDSTIATLPKSHDVEWLEKSEQAPTPYGECKEHDMMFDVDDVCPVCDGFTQGCAAEQERIIKLLTDLNAIRRDALGHLVAFNTDGTEVIYLDGLEAKK